MVEDFGDCYKGSAIWGSFLALIFVIVSLVSTFVSSNKFDANVILFSLAIFIIYIILSLVLYGYYSWTKSQLEQNATIFVIGTIVITAGGWWLGYLLSLLLVKINCKTYNLLISKRS